MNRMQRNYAPLAQPDRYSGDRRSRMQQVVDLIWETFADQGVSWVGFYLPETGEAEASDESTGHMVLGPMRDKPACSPIGLHGACGQTFRSRQPMVVRDVADLGADYIACDPRDRSEVVVPLLDADGVCQAVIDLDSHERDAFSEHDVAGLTAVLRAARLTA